MSHDIKQWWIFDWRTRTIRPQARRNYAISIQQGGKNWYYYHYSAVIRQFRGESLQKIRFFGGSRRNIRDQGVRCLDVHGNSNTNNRHVHWYKCHNGLNQAWYIDQRAVKYPAYPVRDGLRFAIRTKMSSAGRAAQYVGGYIKLIDFDPSNKEQIFTFDTRTRTVRQYYRRSYVISAQSSNYYRNGMYARLTSWNRNRSDQRMRWFNGSRRNLRNLKNMCFDIRGGNRSNNYIIWHNCHNGMNQAWWLDTQLWYKRSHPLSDGVRFQIRSRLAGNRAVYYDNHIGANHYQLRIRDTRPGDTERQWFVFDRRTHSIRSFSQRNYAISHRYGYKFRVGSEATMGLWRN